MPRARTTHRNSTSFDRYRVPLMLGGGLVCLLAMSFWGGTAQPGPTFWLGIGVLCGLLLLFGVAMWWLFLSPLPVSQQSIARPNATVRQFVAFLASASGLLFLVGGMWDEAWHQLYGVSAAVDDFWWRPHLLIYGSMGINALLALGALLYAARGGGGLRARFRSDPLIGLLGFMSLYLLVAAPSDLIWHQIYGTEITAWSLPHLLMGVGSVAVLLAAVAVQTSVLPAHKQWDTRRLNLGELNVVVLLTIAASIMLLIGVTEWDHLPAIEPGTLEASPFLQAFWARPLWLYPVVVLAIALFCGQISLQVLQRPGAAVLVMAGALFIRAVANFLLQEMSGEFNTSAVSQFLALIPAAAMDLAYIYLMPSADRPYTALYASLTGIVAMMTGGLILLPRLLIYPPITEETVPSMVVMGVLVGLWSGWCGSNLGQWIGTVKRLPQPAGSRQVQVLAAGAGLLIAAMAFSVFFIVTAPPPM